MEDIFSSFVMSGILAKQADEFSGEFYDEFQTHRGQKAEVSRECPEPVDGEMLVCNCVRTSF